MSDLAPFVAAIIRDRVVTDQQDEIESLKQKVSSLVDNQRTLERRLLERTPLRSIEMVTGDGRVLVQCDVDVSQLVTSMADDTTRLFEGEPDVSMTVQEFLATGLVIDGTPAVSFSDLTFTGLRYL